MRGLRLAPRGLVRKSLGKAFSLIVGGVLHWNIDYPHRIIGACQSRCLSSSPKWSKAVAGLSGRDREWSRLPCRGLRDRSRGEALDFDQIEILARQTGCAKMT